MGNGVGNEEWANDAIGKCYIYNNLFYIRTYHWVNYSVVIYELLKTHIKVLTMRIRQHTHMSDNIVFLNDLSYILITQISPFI